MSEITFPDQPAIDSIPAELKAIAKNKKVTNLLIIYISKQYYHTVDCADRNYS